MKQLGLSSAGKQIINRGGLAFAILLKKANKSIGHSPGSIRA